MLSKKWVLYRGLAFRLFLAGCVHACEGNRNEQKRTMEPSRGKGCPLNVSLVSEQTSPHQTLRRDIGSGEYVDWGDSGCVGGPHPLAPFISRTAYYLGNGLECQELVPAVSEWQGSDIRQERERKKTVVDRYDNPKSRAVGSGLEPLLGTKGSPVDRSWSQGNKNGRQ